MPYALIWFLFLALLCILLPGIVVIAVPAKAARATVGWVIFVIGLLVVDYWTASVQPYDDDGVFPDPSILVFTAWGVTLAIAIAARGEALFGSRAGPPRHPALSWSIPFGALAGVVFLHWLRNRLAGIKPAEWVHAAVIAAFTAIILAAAWALARNALRFTTPLWVIMSFSTACLVLTAANAAMGFWMWQHAREFAAGKPYCVIAYRDFPVTYGNFGKNKRFARSGWDLSPLVNRRYGVWAVRKTPFMVVREEAGTKSYRYFLGKWDDVTGWDEEYYTPDCQP